MSDLQSAVFAPLILLLLGLLYRRWPSLGSCLADLPCWSALAYVLPFAIAGVFTFPSLDDWCYGASGRHGWWSAQQAWYVGWSGRITTTAVLTGWGVCGSPWFAAAIGYRLIITALFAATCWALWELLGSALPQVERRQRGTLALAAAAGWLCLLSDPSQGLYWLPGVASYGIGTIFTLVACSAVLRGANGSRCGWWLALVTLVLACWSSEVVAAVALTAVFGLVALRLRDGDRWRGLVVLAGGLLATVILLLAPGNVVRALVALNEGQPATDHAPCAVVLNTVMLMWRFTSDTNWAPLTALSAWLAWRSPSCQPRRGAALLLAVPAFILVAALPMAWAGMSPQRAWNPLAASIAVTVVIGAWVGGRRLALPMLCVAGGSLISCLPPGLDALFVSLGAWTVVLGVTWFLCHKLDRQTVIAMLACTLLVGSGRFTTAVMHVARGPHYANEQQQRLTILATAAPGSAVVMPRLTGDLPYLYHVDDLNFSATSWANQGCANFFKVESVAAK